MPVSALCGTEPKKIKRAKKNAPKPLTQFHLFPKLPYDLQYEIWMLYIDSESEQCIIALTRKKGNHNQLGFKCLSLLPTALVVNRYLREVALRRYKLSFGTIHCKPSGYFNFQNDRLFICNVGACEVLDATKALKDHGRKRVRLLALPLRDW
jgi:hypothetical protein